MAHMSGLSVSAFTLAVAEEFVLLCVAGSLFAALNVALVHRPAAAFDRRTRT